MREAVERFSGAGATQAAERDAFARRLHYRSGDSPDAGAWTRLAAALFALDRESGDRGNRIFYTAAHDYRDLVGQAKAVDVGQAIGLCRLRGENVLDG